MDTLKKNKYKYVKKMLSTDMVDFLSTWSVNQTHNALKNDIVRFSINYHSRQSDIYSHVLHWLLPTMEKETGLKLKPTYSYNRIYLGGSELVKHKDRNACEISASITLKYHYENENYKWPLCMGNKPIVIESGDGVIYKGIEIEHWRPIFNQPKEYWHHQLFIHYVDVNGPYSDIKEEV